MATLIQVELAKTKKKTKIKLNVEEVLQKILSVKNIINFAVQTMPQAALAWTNICFALQVNKYFFRLLNLIVTSKDLY